METATGFGGLVTLLIILAVVWKLGLFRPIIVLADIANREAGAWDGEHKAKVVDRYAENTLDDEKVARAAKNKSTLDSFDFD